jgi:hypothetical protein
LTDRGAEAKQEDFPGTEGSYRSGRDLALVNAEILTLETNPPEAEAALVRGGRIVAVGSNDPGRRPRLRTLARNTLSVLASLAVDQAAML